MGLISETAMPQQVVSIVPARPTQAKYAVATLSERAPIYQTSTPSGTEVALKVLQSTLIGGAVSSQTNELIHKQMAQATEQNTSPSDMLNLLTALVMGSPEFQLR